MPRAPCANIRRPGARTREAAVPVVGLFESLKVGALREATTSSFPRACRLPGKLQVSEERGITVIEGGCPCMFGPTADPGHKAMRFVYTLTGNVPRRV